MKISSLKPGMVLWDVRRKGGIVRPAEYYRVLIAGVSEDGKSFTASWNNNPCQVRRTIPSTWRKKKPEQGGTHGA